MRIIFYNYYMPFRKLFKQSDHIETFEQFKDFRKEWDKDEECVIILPVGVYDLIGLDIRLVFREFGRDDKKRFLLIGDKKQIEFALSQNDKFLQNTIQLIEYPVYFDVFRQLIDQKIEILKTYKKRK